jgi:hypothetical protein
MRNVWRGDFMGYWGVVMQILHVNFREYLFHELG